MRADTAFVAREVSHDEHCNSEAEIMEQTHSLPVLKVTLPPDASDAEADSPWKLDRRDSGSLFWRRDSVACKTSRIKFRCDVDVREYQPRPEERHLGDLKDAEDEDDIYSDDYILKHDMDASGAAGSWLRPCSLRPNLLFGYRGLPLGRQQHSGGPDARAGESSSVVMSLVCLMAILVTAWLQGSISHMSLR